MLHKIKDKVNNVPVEVRGGNSMQCFEAKGEYAKGEKVSQLLFVLFLIICTMIEYPWHTFK